MAKDVTVVPDKSALHPAAQTNSQAALKVQEMMQRRNVSLARASGQANVSILLDKSISMVQHKEATINGFNEFLTHLKQYPNVLVSFYQFDNEFEQMYVAKPVATAPKLDKDTYQPRGGTALIRSVLRQIAEAKKVSAPGVPTVCVIQTDGQNTGAGDWADVRKETAQLLDQNWRFLIMGADLDAYELANNMGIPIGAAMTYDFDASKTQAAFKATADVIGGFLAGQKKAEFSKEQREQAATKEQLKFVPKALLK